VEPTVRPGLAGQVAVKRGRDAATRLPNNPETGCLPDECSHSLTRRQRLQRYTIATNHAVSAAFPQIEEIGGLRPDPLHEHDEDPTSPEGVALGDEIRDFLLTRADELGIDHVLWRQHVYRADGASEPMEPRGGDLANHVTHVHVTTKGGGVP
jgi:hypothetical protein